MYPRVLTIAGSDTTGGAGQLADLKTFEEYGVFGMVALTCIVSLDKTQDWTPDIHNIDTDLLKQQLDTAFFASPLAAVKTGMIGDAENIKVVGEYLRQFKPHNIVIDPVMACKRSDNMHLESIRELIKTELIPQATITTPNLIEAEYLTDMTIQTVEDMKAAADMIVHQLGAQAVVVKGGHRLPGDKAVDVFYDGHDFTLLEHEKLENTYNHGAGCTFAAAITAGLAKGYSPLEAVKQAKAFVTKAIERSFKVNDKMSHVWHGAYNEAENRMNPHA